MNLLRIITPEEIADIATKHNGGKFLSLTDLVNERVELKIYRDFAGADSVDHIHDEHTKQQSDKSDKESLAKILPFNNKNTDVPKEESSDENPAPRFVVQSITSSQKVPHYEVEPGAEEKAEVVAHKEGENMSSFIMIEKARLKHSQKSLKQKEIIDLYQKNSNVDVEQIKATNQNSESAAEAGVLVNKKQY